MLSICDLLSSGTHWPQNFLHGQVLQVLLLIKAHRTSNQTTKSIFESLNKVQHQTMNAVVLTSIFDIYNESLKYLEKVDWDLEEIKCNYSKSESFYYPVFRKSLLIFKLHKYRLQSKPNDILSALCGFDNSSYEEIEAQLNIMLLKKSGTLDEEFEVRKDESDISRLLADENESWNGLEDMLDQVIATKVFYPECTMKAYAVYASLQCELKFSIEEIIDLSFNQIGHSKIPLAMCVEKITRTNNSFELFKKCLSYLKDISQPGSPDTLRFKASCILGNICFNLELQALKKEELKVSVDSILLFYDLLQDDDVRVRTNTSEVVLKCIGADLSGKLKDLESRIF